MSKQEKRDYLFTALARMGNASSEMAWANNCVEDINEVPADLKEEMVNINRTIYKLQERLREVSL